MLSQQPLSRTFASRKPVARILFTRKSLAGLLLTTTLLPALAWGDELADLRARNAQLEATVEELTLQLAEALQERRRLEASLAEATASLAAAEASLAATAQPAPQALSESAEAPVAAQSASPAAASGGAQSRMVEEEIIAASGAAAASGSGAMTVASAMDTSGCSVSEALDGYDGKRKGNEALTAWLKSANHLEVCSTAQLEEIRGAIKWDWLGYQKEAIRMLDKELEARR